MKRWLGLFLLFTMLALRSWGGDASLLAARQAQALLGPEVWSRIIRVENIGSTTHYPRALHALVFEIAGILWFYTDGEGTQSFSTHRGRLAEDRANFTVLLHAIHPGFVRWKAVAPSRVSTSGKNLRPRNACFLESLAELRRRTLAGTEVLYPKILCLVEETAGRRTGHAVLTFETASGIEVVDPVWPRDPTRLPFASGLTASDLSRALGNTQPEHARWVAVGDYPVTLLAFHRTKSRLGDTAQAQELAPPLPSIATGAG